MIYTPRTIAPESNNLYYIKTTHGGYNKCIVIDEETGSVLPNCTGYAWGRFMECQNNVHDCNLSRGNADQWYGNTGDNYLRGQLPKLGAVICFTGGQSGHVAIVENIEPNGDILISNSAYNGQRFYLRTLTYASGWKYDNSHTFQGFIYNPTNFENDPSFTLKRKKFPFVLYSRKLKKLREKRY